MAYAMTRFTVRLFTALVMLYLTLDCAAPSLPGALSFNADDSIEVVRSESLETATAPMLAMQPERPMPTRRAASSRVTGRPSQIERDGATPYRAFARSAPAPSGEDA